MKKTPVIIVSFTSMTSNVQAAEGPKQNPKWASYAILYFASIKRLHSLLMF